MSNIIWQSPVPSSGFLRGVSVQLRPRREIALAFEFEDANEEMHSGELVFSEVVHYRTTYMPALRADVIREAYDRVVDVGTSPELLEVVAAMEANRRTTEVRHYRVCFDDGPCFDFIAAAFEPLTS
jgi:hypothetical protein